jgi:PhzF family phenazine biosynthesis protein
MALRPFVQLDVFSREAMRGNALAVVLDGRGLDTATMQAFAQWTNLSETTFVVDPSASEASYALRIFTPRSELPFAGHPSVGTAWALLDAGIVSGSNLIQECAAGLLNVAVSGQGGDRRVSVQSPQARRQALSPPIIEALPRALGCMPCGERPIRSDVGARWVLLEVPNRAAVRALKPDRQMLIELSQQVDVAGVAVFSFEPELPIPLELRAFAPHDGIDEDPVTGSAQAAVGDWLLAQGRLSRLGGRYLASQGHVLGRSGRVHVHADGQHRIHIGGECVALVRGAVSL